MAKFAADLTSDACYTDMDGDRRQAILATLAWFNMGCDENALVYGVTDDIDLGVIPKPKPKKEAKKKAPKKAAAKKKTPRKRAAKKKPAAAAAAAAEGDEAAPAAEAAPAPKRKLRRSSKTAE